MEDGYTWLHAAREGIFYFNYVNRAGYDTQPSGINMSIDVRYMSLTLESRHKV